MIILTIFQLILKKLLRWRLVTLFFHWHYHLQLFQTQARVGLCPHGAAGISGREGQKCHSRPNMSGWGRQIYIMGWQAADYRNDLHRGWLPCFSTRSTLSSCQNKFRSWFKLSNWIELMKLNESKYNVRTTWGWPHTSPHRIPGCTQGWGEQLTT